MSIYQKHTENAIKPDTIYKSIKNTNYIEIDLKKNMVNSSGEKL